MHQCITARSLVKTWSSLCLASTIDVPEVCVHGTYRRNLESIRRRRTTSVAFMFRWTVESVERQEAVGNKMFHCVSIFCGAGVA